MKKVVLFVIIVFFAAGMVFAQSYTVQSVAGRVQREAGSNRIDVKVNDTLTSDTVIHVGVGASLILKDADKTYTVSAARRGKLEELISASSGVRITGNVTRADVGTTGRTTGQVATASARASDEAEAEDDDIAAE